MIDYACGGLDSRTEIEERKHEMDLLSVQGCEIYEVYPGGEYNVSIFLHENYEHMFQNAVSNYVDEVSPFLVTGI